MGAPEGMSIQDLLKKYGRRSIIMAVADNMGFKRKGGYMQTAVHALLVIAWEDIVKIGAHKEEFWIRPEWEKVRDDEEFTMGFDAEGETTLVQRRKLAWGDAVELWKCTTETDGDEAQGDTASNDLDEDTHPNVRRDDKGTVVLEGRVLGLTGETSVNQLEANKTAMQETRLEDFSSTDVLLKLAECWKEQVDFLKGMPEGGEDDDWKEGEIKRMIDKMKVQVLTDGKPAIQFSDAKNRGDAPVLDDFEFFCGRLPQGQGALHVDRQAAQDDGASSPAACCGEVDGWQEEVGGGARGPERLRQAFPRVCLRSACRHCRRVCRVGSRSL